MSAAWNPDSTTAAPGSTAPESSTTAPRTTAWAAATLVMVIAEKIARRAGAKRFIIRSPSTSDVSALSHRSHAHLLVSSQQREELREELPIVAGHDSMVEHETDWTVGGRNRRRDGCSPRFGPMTGAAASRPIEVNWQLLQATRREHWRARIGGQQLESELDESRGGHCRTSVPGRRENWRERDAEHVLKLRSTRDDVIALLDRGPRPPELRFAAGRLVIDVGESVLVDGDEPVSTAHGVPKLPRERGSDSVGNGGEVDR